ASRVDGVPGPPWGQAWQGRTRRSPQCRTAMASSRCSSSAPITSSTPAAAVNRPSGLRGRLRNPQSGSALRGLARRSPRSGSAPSSPCSFPIHPAWCAPPSGPERKVRGSAIREPGIALGVLRGVVGIEIDEHALDLPVADLEDIAPAAGGPVGDAGAPGAVAVLAVAGSLADDEVAAREDPVEAGVVVDDRLDGGADVAE